MRITRFGTLVAALASLPVALSAQPRTPVYTPGTLTPNQQLAREIYEELIEINTGVETGNITTAAVAMAKRFREAGIPEADIFVGGPRPEKHNVVARIRGKADLTRASRSAARAPRRCRGAQGRLVAGPRSVRFHGAGRLLLRPRHGRRQSDGGDLRRECLPHEARKLRPDRDIIIALTADEESGPANGVDWLLKNHKEQVDAAHRDQRRRRRHAARRQAALQLVQASEKITTNFTLRATNSGGHSSVPRSDNAITALADALAKVGRHSFPIKLTK